MTFAEQPYGPLVDTAMRVVTWNVWGRFGPWQERQRGIVATLRAAQPDVVLLQECWVDDTGADQGAVLASELGFEHAFGGGELLFGDWGLATPCCRAGC